VVTDQSESAAQFLAPNGQSEALSLTRHEWSGLMSRHNLADGHAKQGPSNEAINILGRLTEIYQQSGRVPQFEVQRAYEDAFFGLAGQPSVANRIRRPQHHYSSSLSIEVIANHLRHHRMVVGLLQPTFDNIPAILRRHSIQLVPISEAVFDSPGNDEHYAGIDALFIVTPNNPTGADPTPDSLRVIADQCRVRGILLILDFSFRFFSRYLATHDYYDYLESTGVSYIGIEDSGKTWPTLDLKIGSLLADEARSDELQTITDDLLLNVSPFIFALLGEHIRNEGKRDCVRVSGQNRHELAEALAGGPVKPPTLDGVMSVALLRLPDGWSGPRVCDRLDRDGVSVLPGNQFYWNKPEAGDAFLRVALMRPAAEFAESARALARGLERYAEEIHTEPVDTPARSDDVPSMVVSLLSELLERQDISMEDDFFDLGGDSLTAMHFVGRIARRTGLPLRMTVLFANPLLRDFAREVELLRARQGTDAEVGSTAALRAAFGLLKSTNDRDSTCAST